MPLYLVLWIRSSVGEIPTRGMHYLSSTSPISWPLKRIYTQRTQKFSLSFLKEDMVFVMGSK